MSHAHLNYLEELTGPGVDSLAYAESADMKHLYGLGKYTEENGKKIPQYLVTNNNDEKNEGNQIKEVQSINSDDEERIENDKGAPGEDGHHEYLFDEDKFKEQIRKDSLAES